MTATRYPVFVPSKGRAKRCATAKMLIRDDCDFRLVVEPAEVDEYRAVFPDVEILVTPRDEMRLLGVRNWIRDLSIEEGHDRHWQFDDNITEMRRWHEGRRLHVESPVAIRVAEDFTDRYTNVGLTGFNYVMFASGSAPPYRLNNHVYSATLVNNRMPYRWRLLYNDDTDLCLQVLSGGLCIVQLNAFLIQKIGTMIVKGGNTDDLYQDDGRLRMARALERRWPGIVSTDRRFKRPQHVVRGGWRGFDTPLIRRDDLDWSSVSETTYDLDLRRRATKTDDEPARAPVVRDEKLDLDRRAGGLRLLREAGAAAGVPKIDEVCSLANRQCDYLANGNGEPPLGDLQARWYDSIENGAPDFGIYSTPEYLADAFACWWIYSRKYVNLIRSAPEVAALLSGARVVDVGCGLGFSTAMLVELCSTATGTNVPGSYQYAVCEQVAERAGFAMSAEPPKADVVVASEYFEHFADPIEHLGEILEAAEPRTLIVANTFASPSIGHFPSYAGRTGRQTGVAFGKALRAAGFEKLPTPTRFWNDRPGVWVRD